MIQFIAFAVLYIFVFIHMYLSFLLICNIYKEEERKGEEGREKERMGKEAIQIYLSFLNIQIRIKKKRKEIGRKEERKTEWEEKQFINKFVISLRIISNRIISVNVSSTKFINIRPSFSYPIVRVHSPKMIFTW